MDTVADIQASLAQDLSQALRENHRPGANLFLSIWKATSRLGALQGYDEKTCKFINASTLQGAQPAIVILQQGDADKASWLIIRHWQECSREVSSFKAPVPDASEVLIHCDGVLNFIDAELRFR